MQSLRSVNQLRIPRCIKRREFNDAVIELHNYSDASSQGYGCCRFVARIS